MPINSNEINLQSYKGPIRACPLCSNRPPNAALDALLSGKACSLCLGHKFVSTCLNCDGTGVYKGRTVWDGGKSEHSSTCTPCGGKGVYATKKPDDWQEPAPVEAKVVESNPVTV
jgi:hypothetical protein